ncbi:hypothetical protein LTR37_019168 [Vermiconidia calcicola]|uniref:Uncharacterized protein n=1 Tax=Vermiconidia calcicola TaxID=1690605 RepID=A0ACC3MF28_9PEZI|nr:hypothetical protein LTR37_019168 [Vermiconidia calcicola]
MEEDWSEGSIYSGDPARDELVKGAMGRIGRGKPVVIINLLRFREDADYQGLTHALASSLQTGEPPPSASGEEAYFKRYIPAYNEQCQKWFGDEHGKGQKILCVSKGMLPLLNYGRVPEEQGDANYWHAAIVLQYPNFERAMEFQKSDAYWGAAYHRAAALEDNVAWVTQPMQVD